MSKVFISFVQEDREVAEAVKRLLDRQDLYAEADCFLSSESLVGGENWLDRIRKELQACSVLVSLLSKRSIGRPWINFEAGAAWVADKLLPVYFGNMTAASLPRPFADLTAVDLREDPSGLVDGVSNALRKSQLQVKGARRLRTASEIVAAYSGDDENRILQLQRALKQFKDIS